MNKTSKILLFSLYVTIYFVCAGAYVYYEQIKNKDRVYESASEKLISELDNEKKFLQEIGIVNAISIADKIDIQVALKNDDRASAIEILERIKRNFAKSTNIKELKVHIHTADVKSFIRNWKLEKFGDDLSGFRKSIVKVKITGELFFGFEVGRVGLTLRSIVPIIYEDKYIGSLEFIQSFENIVNIFKRKDFSYLLLMDDSLISIAKYLKDAPRVGNYVLSSKKYETSFLKSAQKVDYENLMKNGYFLSSEHFYTFQEIEDTDGKKAGIHLLAMKKESIDTAIEEVNEELLVHVATISGFVFLIIITFWLVIALISSSSSIRRDK